MQFNIQATWSVALSCCNVRGACSVAGFCKTEMTLLGKDNKMRSACQKTPRHHNHKHVSLAPWTCGTLWSHLTAANWLCDCMPGHNSGGLGTKAMWLSASGEHACPAFWSSNVKRSLWAWMSFPGLSWARTACLPPAQTGLDAPGGRDHAHAGHNP